MAVKPLGADQAEVLGKLLLPMSARLGAVQVRVPPEAEATGKSTVPRTTAVEVAVQPFGPLTVRV